MEKSTVILSTALPPMKSRTFVMNRQGELVINPGYQFDPQRLKAIALNAREHRGDFVMDGRYYTYRTVGSQSWLLVHEVEQSELNNLAFQQCLSTLWGTLCALIALLFCWWSTRAALNAIFMRIAASIRGGTIKPASVEELIFEEIHSSQQRQEKTAHEALTDGLTGLKNRRAFDADAARCNSEPNTHLAMVDIDNFKSINDTWGHLSGDIVLRNVAREGLQVMQPHSVSVYRYGGEEFAVIFQAERSEASRQLLEAWRSAVEQREWREDNLHVTFSAGLGEWQFEPLEQFVGRVDAALYQAKQQGKNRILLTSEI